MTELLTLERAYLKEVTLGFLSNGMVTIEPPAKGNIVGESCIPEGTYNVVPDDTGKYRWFSVKDVPDRTFIEFHEGNTVNNTEGCILVGEYFSGNYSTRNSIKALESLKEAYPEGFTLLIKTRNFQ